MPLTCAAQPAPAKASEEDDDDEEDPFDARIRKSGCAEQHYALQVGMLI